MPSEEMELSTDFNHQGEDIDILLDFASGQQDEDLELGDYDQTEEFQHFNSDNRDELMAEDDASYGMIDADDIAYNESAVNANDYDIEIGGTDDLSWQGATTVDPSDSLENAPAAETTADASVDVQPVSTGGDAQLDIQSPTDDSAPHPTAQQAEQVAEINLEAAPSGDVAPVADEHDYASGIASQDFGIPSEDAAQEQDPETYGTEEVEADQQHELDIITSEYKEPEDAEAYEAATEEVIEAIVNPPSDAAGDEPAAEDTNDNETSLVGDDDAEISYDEQDDDVPLQEHTSSADEQHQDHEESPEQHVGATTEGDGEWDSGGAELNAEADEVGDTSYEDEADVQAEQFSMEDDGQEQSVSHDHEEVTDAEGQDTGNEDTNDIQVEGEDLASLAAQHQMFVRYGESDYRLFAKSLDDDPSEYFFKDISALELPLSEFLSGIRSVISEEVSPLDELILHIDGLGLEFREVSTTDYPHPAPLANNLSQSMNSQFLDDYSFAHILKLYHTLVKNDEPGDIPELYMYLMVRPSCVQRLLALQIQAESGKTLTDVAVYREASPDQEEDPHGADSRYTSPEQEQTNEDQPLAISPDYALGELYEDHGEEQSSPQPAEDNANEDDEQQDNEQQDNDQDNENEPEQDAFEEHEYSQQDNDQDNENEPEQNAFEEHQYSQQDDSVAAEGTGDETAADPNEDDLDYDNLDLSPSQQGNFPPFFSRPIPFHCIETIDCECDTCWGQQLEEESLRPRSSSCRHGDVPMHDVPHEDQSSHAGFCGNKEATKATNELFDANSSTKDNADNLNDPTAANVNLTSAPVDSAADTVESKPASDTDHHGNPPSQSTSATATLDGDNDDEIDYDENDNEVGDNDAGDNDVGDNDVGDDTHDSTFAVPVAKLMVPVDEEITWESENEEARLESSATSQPSEQVSTTPGKRTRSDSDAVADADGRQGTSHPTQHPSRCAPANHTADIKRLRS